MSGETRATRAATQPSYSFGVRALRYLNNQSIILHSLGITAFAIAVLAKAPTHQPASFVFSTFRDATGDPGAFPLQSQIVSDFPEELYRLERPGFAGIRCAP